jgi:hypothetical protein
MSPHRNITNVHDLLELDFDEVPSQTNGFCISGDVFCISNWCSKDDSSNDKDNRVRPAEHFLGHKKENSTPAISVTHYRFQLNGTTRVKCFSLQSVGLKGLGTRSMV